MKSLLTAVSLSLVLAPAARAAGHKKHAPAPAKVPEAVAEAQRQLLTDVEIWRSVQLPQVTPPNPLTLRFEPRLDDIKTRTQAAKTAKGLEQPRKDFEDWKKAVLQEKFATAHTQGLSVGGSFDQFAAEQAQRAAFAAAFRSQMIQNYVHQNFLQDQRRALAAASAPAKFFDGANASGAVDVTAVLAPPPADAGSPERYAKVRQILISEGASPKVVDMAIQEAIRQNADPLLVLSVIKQESGFNPHAHSGVGARGLMQIMPDTGRGLGVRDAGALYDVRTNLRAGIRYLKQLWDRFTDIEMSALQNINPWSDHDVKAAVAAYNAGPGAVHKYDGVPPYRETQGYVQKVLGYYSSLKQYLGW